MATIDLTKIISPGFTDSVLQDILRKKSGFTSVIVDKLNLDTATSKGDSYLSIVTRFTINAKGNKGSGDDQDFQVHLIVKSIPYIVARVKSFRSSDFFECEIDFYNKVWPTLDAFQKLKPSHVPFDSIPLCLAAYINGTNGFIAFEDLCYQGYKTIARTSGLDVEMAVFFLKHFAQFHALSIAYRDQHPNKFEELVNSLKETYFDEKFRKWYDGALNKFFIVVKDAAKKELPPLYLEKINEITSQDVFGNICKLLKRKTPLSAITHGDCWIPNFLIDPSGKDIKLKIIDFQLMRCASAVTDVLFLLYTCVDPMVRDEHWNLLIEEYYNCLKTTVNNLGSKLDVSLDTLKDEMKIYGLFAFGMCNESLIMSLMEDEDVADLDSITGSDEIPLHEIWKIEPIKKEKNRQRVSNYLMHLIDNGLI